MSERLYSKFYRARQEKAEHGPGTECSACLCKSTYSSEYMNDRDLAGRRRQMTEMKWFLGADTAQFDCHEFDR